VVVLLVARRRLHDDALLAIDVLGYQLGPHGEIWVLGEVLQPFEGRALFGRERRLRMLAEELVLLCAELIELAHRSIVNASARTPIPRLRGFADERGHALHERGDLPKQALLVVERDQLRVRHEVGQDSRYLGQVDVVALDRHDQRGDADLS
jgi:hypothetical protein